MRKRMLARLFAAVTVAVGIGAGVAMPAQAAPAVDPGTLYELVTYYNVADGPKCLDVPGGSHQPGVLMQVYHCHGDGPQSWQFLDAGGGWYQIKNLGSGLCLEIPSPPWAFGHGIPVEQASCIGYDTQLYRIQVIFDDPAGAALGFVNQWSNACLTRIGDTVPKDSDKVTLVQCNLGDSRFNPGAAEQIWRLG